MLAEKPTDFYVEVDTVNKEQWSDLLLQFDDATIYQTWSYAVVKYGTRHLSHLIIKRNGDVVGMAQLGITKVPFIRAGIATLYWGPLWKLRDSELETENFLYIIKALKNEYVKIRGFNLRIYPYIYDNEMHANELQTNLLNEGFQCLQTNYRTLLINVSPSLDELRKGFIPRWRTDLNRSEKNDLAVVEGHQDELYDEFKTIYDEMLADKQFISFSDPNMFGTIQHDLPQKLKIKILLSRYKGEAIAAALTSIIGNTALGIFWASNTLGRKLKAAYHLQWKTLEMLKTHGCHYYDIGGIDFENNPGSYRFKSGLAGKYGVDVRLIGRFDTCNNLLSKTFIKWGDQLKIIFSKINVFIYNYKKKNH